MLLEHQKIQYFSPRYHPETRWGDHPPVDPSLWSGAGGGGGGGGGGVACKTMGQF